MKIKSESLWREGYRIGRVTENHYDQDTQTFWNNQVLYGDLSYDDYNDWLIGYKTGLDVNAILPKLY